jgi:hypothetical protein
MRLKMTCTALAAAAVALLVMAGVAVAASSPTLKVTGATAVTTSSAVVNATINPNGAKTSYHFSYGPTSALGTDSPEKTLAAGTKTESVSYSLTGLQSGTTYYYDLQAESSAGTVTTKTITFKTAGPSPAQTTTGGAEVLSSSSATVTGVVNPEDANTTYYFEIGTSTDYTLDTVPATVPKGTSPVSVSYTVSGLEPYTTFHYALVASNSPTNSSTGADETFETFPNPVPTAKVVQYTTPHSESGGPFVFNTTGSVENKTLTPDSLACTGTATVAFYYGKHLVYRQLAPLDSTCGFSAATEFAHLPVKGHKSEKLLVYVRFDGNGYLKAVSLKPESVTLG